MAVPRPQGSLDPMSVTESLQVIDAWLLEHGMGESERPAPVSPDVLGRLADVGTKDAVPELIEFYGHQNGLPHWFVLYGTWQFLTLEEALEQTETLVRSSAHLDALLITSRLSIDSLGACLDGNLPVIPVLNSKSAASRRLNGSHAERTRIRRLPITSGSRCTPCTAGKVD